MTRRLSALAALTVLLRLAGASAEDETGTAVAGKIVIAGLIMTLNNARPMAEALAALDGGIIAISSHDEVIKLKGNRTEVVDLGGKTFVPGFIALPLPLAGDTQRPIRWTEEFGDRKAERSFVRPLSLFHPLGFVNTNVRSRKHQATWPPAVSCLRDQQRGRRSP